MKLFYSPASPFVRKVMICALERGLADRIEKVASATTPVDQNQALAGHNPLAKIPALVLDDGTALYDSRVICEYLDSLGSAPRLVPAEGAARWRALVLQALADGLCDAAVLGRYEKGVRPAEKQWANWLEGQMARVDRALDMLEAECTAHLGGGLDIGGVAVACACGYLDFRYADREWRKARPKLAAWYESFAKRPSMQATVPVG